MTDLSQPASAGTEPLGLQAALKTTTAALPPGPANEAAILLSLPPALRKPRLRRWEASEYLLLAHGVTMAPATLAKLASIGGGPAFERIGRTPLYRRETLDAWVAERLSAPVRSTSQIPARS